jgi:hypothetical protein
VEATHVEVVDDLREQVVDVLDELRVALDVAGDAEPAQDLLAEAVGRGDRRRVEVGEAVGEARAADRDRLARSLREQAHDRVLVARRRAGQALGETLLGGHEPFADTIAQLAGRHARERHQQQPRERRALRHVAGGQRRDRERLAGAGARFEHRHAARQRPADVERPHAGRRIHRSPSSSQDSRPCHMRRA